MGVGVGVGVGAGVGAGAKPTVSPVGAVGNCAELDVAERTPAGGKGSMWTDVMDRLERVARPAELIDRAVGIDHHAEEVVLGTGRQRDHAARDADDVLRLD